MTHTTPMQFADALGCLKRVRTLLIALIFFCLLGQLGGFVYLNFISEGDTPVAQVPEGAKESVQGETPADAVDLEGEDAAVADVAANEADLLATAKASDEPMSVEEMLESDPMHQMIFWGLALTKLAALILSVLLMMTFMFAAQVSLVGQLGATAGFLSAFCWSMFIVVLLVPWQQVGSAMACGATFNFGQWLAQARVVRANWGAAQQDIGATVVYYIRFLLYPIVTLVIVMIAGARFGAGYRPIRLNQKMAATMGGPIAGQPAATSAPHDPPSA
jgi:hypothetical protein